MRSLALSPEILALLRCPKTQQRLHVVSPDADKVWQALDPTAENFLVTEDGQIAYPIDDGYPILLIDRALERVAQA